MKDCENGAVKTEIEALTEYVSFKGLHQYLRSFLEMILLYSSRLMLRYTGQCHCAFLSIKKEKDVVY